MLISDVMILIYLIMFHKYHIIKNYHNRIFCFIYDDDDNDDDNDDN